MRNEVKVFENEKLGLQVRTILNEDGSISVSAEDTAIGFGWIQTQIKNGKEYTSTRWETLNNYCKELGFPNKLGKDDYIPESLFYMLGMKANNERALAYQKWIAMDLLPTLRKTGSYEIPREEKKQPNQVESLTIKEVKFLDDVLRVGQDKQGRIFVGVNDICKALGMNKARKDKEIIAVQKDETLKKGCKKFSSGAFYWFGSAITLQLDYIPLWLTKIKITPSMRVNNPNAANKLVEYQSQAKDVLAAAFFANNTLITYPPALSHYTASAVAELGRITKSIMEKQGSSPRKIAEIFKLECQQFGIYLPEDFVEMPIYEQLSLDINEIITR